MPRSRAAVSSKHPAGAGRPVADRTSAAGPFAGALDTLRADLEAHRARAIEVEGLVARLTAYAANGHAKPDTPPPKRSPGRPPSSAPVDAERRRIASLKTKRWRAKRKAAEAEDSKKKPGPKPSDGIAAEPQVKAPWGNKRELTEAEQRQLEEMWAEISASDEAWQKAKKADADYRAVRELAMRNRRKGGMLLKRLGPRVSLPLDPLEIKHWREASACSEEHFAEKLAAMDRPKQQITEFVPDENGVLTRTNANGAAAPTLNLGNQADA